tara:strand:+ start:3751 stop:3975 length:225 start_codon:yes stop_codon:yes gene_type:complete
MFLFYQEFEMSVCFEKGDWAYAVINGCCTNVFRIENVARVGESWVAYILDDHGREIGYELDNCVLVKPRDASHH